jgi:hypothetical protein
MKNSYLLLLIALVVVSSRGYGQNNATSRLDSIYKQLVEYNTDNDPFEEWAVTDDRVIREVLSRILNSGRIWIPGPDQHPMMQTKIDPLNVRIVCRKRLKVDEVEEMRLSYDSSGVRRDLAIRDFVLIRDILGDEMYQVVKDLHKKDRDGSKHLYRTDLYLHPLRPSLQVFGSDSRHSNSADYYAVSLFGRLGNDALDLPFWYRGTMIGGLSLTHMGDLPENVDPDYSLYRIRLGVEEPVNFSFPSSSQPSENSLFKDRRLEGSGTSVYLQGSYAPWSDVPFLGIDTAGYVRLNAELCVAIEDRDKFSPRVPETFYSIRNYVSLLAEVRRLGLFNLGAGLAWHDVHHFSKNLVDGRVSRIDPTTNNILASIEVGIAEEGSILQYDIKTSLHFSLTEGYGYLMVKPVFMISNILGIEVTYSKAIRASHLPVWHYDSYLVFAPFLRINF